MSATILDGKSLAQQIRSELAEEVAALRRDGGPQPVLAAVLVGSNPASEVYVRYKRRDCGQVGIESQLYRLPETASETELLDLIDQLNRESFVHGILVQLPVPPQIRTEHVLEAICPDKDVDAFHPDNVGRLLQGRPRFLPCTPHAVQQLLLRNNIPIAGAHVVIVGRSDIVGKPLACMLMQRNEGANATVTVCHSHTQNLAAVTRLADVLVVAIGKPKFLTVDMVRPGATVIDVGINRTDAGLVGDVDYQAVAEVAGHITPVPGGVGPLTRTMLLVNTLAAARSQTWQDSNTKDKSDD
jgi:methylenetetrahydrofolate dehydrogenase (NADP+)/methenyltetrahydrofolate cyclohydrolase